MGRSREEMDRRIRESTRDIEGFPKEGVVFKDITTVLRDGPLFADIIDHLAARYADQELDRVIGIESRGFIFGAPLAYELGVGLTLIRKPGKLPHETVGVDYELEYGSDRVEMHRDAFEAGQRVLLVDDLLATGGTCAAAVELIERLDGDLVEIAFLMELGFLEGRQGLDGRSVYSITTYE